MFIVPRLSSTASLFSTSVGEVVVVTVVWQVDVDGILPRLDYSCLLIPQDCSNFDVWEAVNEFNQELRKLKKENRAAFDRYRHNVKLYKAGMIPLEKALQNCCACLQPYTFLLDAFIEIPRDGLSLRKIVNKQQGTTLLEIKLGDQPPETRHIYYG
ncbi:hypothetical protein K439DRAFT_1631123 [Ramaria rubella]|nr:hypothetical protein K439DRAFT_1631123 [Ramaria rubella]